MANYLNDLKREYEFKRLKALKDCDDRKQELYSNCPRLSEIDLELSNYSLSIAKSILTKSNQKNIEDLKIFFEKLKQEKILLLKKMGKTLTYLEPIFECPICKDEGYVKTQYKTEVCNCLKQKLYNIAYNQSNIGNLANENFQHFNAKLYTDKVDKVKYGSDISPRENIVGIKNLTEQFVNNFDDPEEKNLLFTGNCGLGKTFLSNCIANELLKKGKTVLYQTSPNMISFIMDAIFNKSNNKDIIENLLNVDLLIIDDLGTETMNSMKFTELFNIINSRLLNQNKKITKTIISTNLTLQNIYEVYDERIVSRIVGYYNICKFFGDDIRFIKR